MGSRRAFLRLTSSAIVGSLVGCDVREFARRRGAKLRLSVVTGPVGGVYYVYGGAVAKVISARVRNVEATAEVTAASVDNLKLLGQGAADLAFVLATALHEAHTGTGAFGRFGRVPARALASLYVQYTHVVTFARSGIASLGDLRGRVVAVGGPGSGTEAIALHILEAAGLDPARDVRRHGLGVNVAAEALRDGKIDALFWSSGLPTGPLVDLASTHGDALRWLSTAEVLPALARRFGSSLYFEAVIPAGTYAGLTAAVPTAGSTTLLVADERLSEDLAYEVTRALFDARAELIAVHPAARELIPESAAAGSPAPFHPGAIRYYRERGVWRG